MIQKLDEFANNSDDLQEIFWKPQGSRKELILKVDMWLQYAFYEKLAPAQVHVHTSIHIYTHRTSHTTF